MTTAVEETPDQADVLTLTFEKGLPVAVNGQKQSLVTIIESLNLVAGKHGIGRIDKIENRLVGIKSREIYEAPAAAVIMTAHKDLEDLTLERDLAHFKPIIEQKVTELLYNGLYFSPLFDAAMAFIKKSQEVVNGEVKVKLFKGQVTAIARQSETNSLYDENLATYTDADSFDQVAAAGFIKLWSLPTTVFEQVNHTHSNK